MKKIFSVILCVSLALCLTACEGAPDSSIILNDRGRSYEREPVETTEAYNPDFSFSTTDRNGVAWNQDCFRSNQVTMINFWEPWCGPCVSEIPDLERLYQSYKSRGFTILGVYSETEMEEEVDEIIRENDVSYPVLHYSYDFEQFKTGYVPTTIFVDSKGHVMTVPAGGKNVVGSNSFEDWKEIIETLLNES